MCVCVCVCLVVVVVFFPSTYTATHIRKDQAGFLLFKTSVCVLRGPAPKKRPMISGSKIDSADFYFPRRGNLVPRVSHLIEPQTFSADDSKIRSKISPRKKKTVQKSLSKRKIIIKKLHSVEEESLLMQYCSINIAKLPKRIKK